MSTSHPLNQAVIAQALYDLRNGQLRRCKAMGFGEAELDALKHPALISVLANASVSWCSVTVNREVLQRLLNQAQDVEKEIATVDRMLRLGASTEMVSRFYGLTHQEVALRREILGLPKRKGRHPVLDETQDTELWRQWKAVTSSRNVDLEDETSILDAAMDLAEGTCSASSSAPCAASSMRGPSRPARQRQHHRRRERHRPSRRATSCRPRWPGSTSSACAICCANPERRAWQGHEADLLGGRQKRSPGDGCVVKRRTTARHAAQNLSRAPARP